MPAVRLGRAHAHMHAPGTGVLTRNWGAPGARQCKGSIPRLRRIRTHHSSPQADSMVGRFDARARKSGVIVATQYAYAVRVSSQP